MNAQKRVEWILVKEALFKGEGDDSNFDSSFCDKFKSADSLAIAMEARGYQGGKGEVNTDN